MAEAGDPLTVGKQDLDKDTYRRSRSLLLSVIVDQSSTSVATSLAPPRWQSAERHVFLLLVVATCLVVTESRSCVS
jgi:hypothetical protein